MQKRSFGVTTLAFSSVMVGLYCQFAAITLMLAGSVFTPTGSISGAITLLLGAVFLGTMVAAYFLGYGFWTRKHWSWAGGVALFGVLAGSSLVLSVMASNYLYSITPLVAGVLVVWYLNRPAIKAELLGQSQPEQVQAAGTDGLKSAELAH